MGSVHPLKSLGFAWLATDHEPHWSEDASGTTPLAANASGLEHDLCLGGALWYNHDGLKQLQERREDAEDDGVELETRKHPRLPCWCEWTVPWLATWVGVERTVAGFNEFKAGVNHGLGADRCVTHIGKAVALLDRLFDPDVLGILLVVVVSEAPLVGGKDATRLEDTENLRVDTVAIWGMAGGLNGIDAVKAVVWEWQLHEVTLDEFDTVRGTLLLGEGVAALDLEVVDGNARNVSASEFGNVASRASDATTAVEEFITFLHA